MKSQKHRRNPQEKQGHPNKQINEIREKTRNPNAYHEVMVWASFQVSAGSFIFAHTSDSEAR